MSIVIKDILRAVYLLLREIKVRILVYKFKLRYPHTKYFFNKERRFYSQANQDYIVYENFFKNYNEPNKFFCDIGGNHPVNLNNTIYFETYRGGEWSGIAFEPLPEMAKLWKETRKAKLFPFALSDKQGQKTFVAIRNKTGWEDMLSYVKNDEKDIKFDDYEKNEVVVDVKVFKDIAIEENISRIDYLSLDVEGHELNVLQGIDFNYTTINVMTIENNTPNSIYGDDRIRYFMTEKGFLLWGRVHGLDDIYVRKGFYECIK